LNLTTRSSKMSRSISESLWRKAFLKADGRYDGQKFEQLALELLNGLYGRGWRPTGITNDGSRDFEKCNREEWLWAECKAYSDRLSVYVISPTLVMAVIEQPDTVIVVSRSPLNDNAFRHLAAFQSASGKRIIALDGAVLDNAILGMGLSGRYFPGLLQDNSSLSGFLIQSSVTPDALREPTDIDLLPYAVGIRPRRTISAVRYSLIRIDLALRNLDALTDSKIKLEIVKKSLDPSLRLVSFGGSKDRRSISISIPPGGIVRTSLILQPREASQRLRLPEISATGSGAQEKLIESGSVYVSHLYQIEMVGKDHRRILRQASSFVRARRRPVVISTEGASGSGKSRLMLEIAKIGLEEGFRCHFYNPEFEDAKAAENVLRDLIADISELPRLTTIHAESDLQGATPAGSVLLRALYDPTFNLWDHVSEVTAAVISLLTRRPTLLIVDNLQFTDDRFADFIDSLILQLDHLGNKRIVLVLSINTDFVSSGGKVNELLMRLRARSRDRVQGRTIHHSQLKDFGTDDVAEFVGSALSGQTSSAAAARLYQKTLDLLLRSVEPRPLNLWQSLMYLADEGVLSLQDDRLMVSGDELLLSPLENIPAGLDDLLELRWSRIRKNEARKGVSEAVLDRTVRAIYFLGYDIRDRLIAAGASKEAIERLLRAGILVNKSGGFIQFFHNQVFAFFRKRFLSLKKRTALRLRSIFQSHKLVNVKFQQYFIVCHFAGKVSGPLLLSTVRRMKENGLTIDYWRQYTGLLLFYLMPSTGSLTATTLNGVTLIGDWQQRLDSLQKGRSTLRCFLTERVLTKPRKGLPGPALFEFYTATINACLAVYEDAEALEVITIALHDLRLSRFPDRKSRNSSLASVLNRKAATLKNFGRIDEALEAGYEALEKFEKIRDYSMVVETLFDLGSVSFGLPDHQNADDLFKRGCELFRLYESAMREPAPCRYFYVSGRLAIRRHDFLTAFELCSRGVQHADRLGISFWGIRLILLEAVARLLVANSKRDLKIVNELLIKARDWSNISQAERSRTALSYMDGKLLVKVGDYARAGGAFSEAVRTLGLQLRTPEQTVWKSSLLYDIAATCRKYQLVLEEDAVSLLNSSALRSEIFEIQNMSDELFAAFDRRRAKQAAFVYRNQIVELP
jgi:tetratricopeptide (TPR) repeat protein